MTNKTREKLREEFDLYIIELILEIGRQVTDDYDFKGGIWEGMSIKNVKTKNMYVDKLVEAFEHRLTQSNNRILRKWKKAIEESRAVDNTRYLEEVIMNDEYLKAKGK